MDSRGSRVALAVVGVLVVAGLIWWVLARAEDVPQTGVPATPAETVARGDEELPFDDPIEEPTLDDEFGEPPADDGEFVLGEGQRWPVVSDAAIEASDQAFELAVAGGGRLLVLVDCDSPAFGMSIAVAAVGLPADTDVLGLLSPEADARPGLVTDPSGNGFGAVTLDLPEATYRLTFDTLGNASVTLQGCPGFFTDTTVAG
jgi:hypothetical protein